MALARPAGAATQQVQARDNFFSPANVTIDPGDTVEWRQAGILPHNVRFDDDSFERPASPQATSWTASRTFTAPGTFAYYCEQHGNKGGVGMSGTVVVTSPGGGGGAEPTPLDRRAPRISRLDAGQTGRRISAAVTTDEPGRLTVVLARQVRSRGLRRVARITRGVRAGTTKVSFARTSKKRRLAPGRYVVTATVRDAARNLSAKRTDRVRLRALPRRP